MSVSVFLGIKTVVATANGIDGYKLLLMFGIMNEKELITKRAYSDNVDT